MSTAAYVYSVPVDKLRAVPGSNDKKLLAAARRTPLQSFFETIDQIAEERDDDEEEAPPKCAEAFRQIVQGAPGDERFGYVYGYAYEAICMAIGAEPERCWTGIAASFEFESLDRALGLLDIPLSVDELLYRGFLIEIPRPNDYPGVGWWTAEEVAAAAEAFRPLDLTQVEWRTRRKIRRYTNEIEDIRTWIEFAAGRPGDWLIGVHC